MTSFLGARPSRRALLAGGTALALASVAAGIASAQTPPVVPTAVPTTAPTTAPAPDAPIHSVRVRLGAPPFLAERQDKLMDAVAAKLGVSRETLDQAFRDASREVGAPDGDFLMPVPAIVAAGPVGVERVALVTATDGGKVTFTIGAATDDEAAAKAIGISVDQLRAEMADKSLADVARAHGVDPTTVVEALKASAKARIDEARASGDLPPELADRLERDMFTAIERMVETKRGEHPRLRDVLFERVHP